MSWRAEPKVVAAPPPLSRAQLWFNVKHFYVNAKKALVARAEPAVADLAWLEGRQPGNKFSFYYKEMDAMWAPSLCRPSRGLGREQTISSGLPRSPL